MENMIVTAITLLVKSCEHLVLGFSLQYFPYLHALLYISYALLSFPSLFRILINCISFGPQL